MSQEGTSEGTQTGAGTGNEAPAWLAQLPVDLKANESFTEFKTVGDFGKSYLELKGKVGELDGLKERMSSAIFKPGENATPEEVQAYQKALGVPEDPKEYEFPKAEGIEHDEKMLDWARQTFKAAALNKDQAKVISTAWDEFVSNMAKADKENEIAGVKAAETALRNEWTGDSYEKNIEITKRGYQAFEKVAPGFAELLAIEIAPGVKLGNDARMLKVFHDIGNRVGDDFSLPENRPKGVEAQNEGFAGIYTKTPPL